MEVLRDYHSVPKGLQGSVLAIGNFDGVHRGHQAVLELAKTAARDAGRPSGVMVFEPHPRQFFERDRQLFRLTPLPLKLSLFEHLELDFVVVLNFDRSLASLEAERFVGDVLRDGLRVHHVITGHDFKFGRGRGGSAESLAAMGPGNGFTSSAVAPVGEGEGVFSSSRVRALLRQAEPRAAADMLGYWWCVREQVIGGAKRGRGLGFPTANLPVAPGMDLAHGVYAVRVQWENQRFDAAAYLGTRPTYNGTEPFIEIFLFDFDHDIYGAEIDVELIAYLRGDERFSDSQALKAQIAKDCEAARAALAEITQDDPMLAYPLGRRLAGS